MIQQGRIALYRQEWRWAQNLFRQAFSMPSGDWRGSGLTKTLALIGLLSAFFRVNAIELLYKYIKGYTIANLDE